MSKPVSKDYNDIGANRQEYQNTFRIIKKSLDLDKEELQLPNDLMGNDAYNYENDGGPLEYADDPNCNEFDSSNEFDGGYAVAARNCINGLPEGIDDETTLDNKSSSGGRINITDNHLQAVDERGVVASKKSPFKDFRGGVYKESGEEMRHEMAINQSGYGYN